MTMDNKNLRTLISFCKKNGVKSLSVDSDGGTKIEFFPKQDMSVKGDSTKEMEERQELLKLENPYEYEQGLFREEG